MFCAFNINIKDVEDTLLAWKAKSMLKKNVMGDLTPFQKFPFYNNSGVKDTALWGDLSFEEAEELLKTMATNEDTSLYPCFLQILCSQPHRLHLQYNKYLLM